MWGLFRTLSPCRHPSSGGAGSGAPHLGRTGGLALGLPGFFGLTMVVSRLSFCSGREGERRACEGGGSVFGRVLGGRARSGASGGVGGARGAVEQRDARADGLDGWDVAGDATERFAWLTASLPECKIAETSLATLTWIKSLVSPLHRR